MGFVMQGRYFAYKTAYDSEHASLAPGIAIVDRAVHEAIEVQSVEEVDLLTGPDPYKMLWSPIERTQLDLLLVGRSRFEVQIEDLKAVCQSWKGGPALPGHSAEPSST